MLKLVAKKMQLLGSFNIWNELKKTKNTYYTFIESIKKIRYIKWKRIFMLHVYKSYVYITPHQKHNRQNT